MSLGGLQPTFGDPDHGLIYDGRQQRRFETRDDTARILMWIETSRLEQTLASHLDETIRRPLVFSSAIDWSSGRSAAVRRAIGYFVSELHDPDGLASVPAALASFTDSFAHLMLKALPHNYSKRLAGPVAPPAPSHLRHAVAFMHASADQPVTIADIAVAAGCGTRTLLNVFRRFRDTTPLEQPCTISAATRPGGVAGPGGRGSHTRHCAAFWVYQSVAVRRRLWKAIRGNAGETRRRRSTIVAVAHGPLLDRPEPSTHVTSRRSADR